jgi:alpha-L-glutamate ligase-like protein
MFNLAQRLQHAGVMGINRRNRDYLFEFNPRRNYPLVDDKVLTKQLAAQAGIAITPLYALIEIQYQVKHLATLLEPYRDFVIKPAQGSGGNGIIVISEHRQQLYRKLNGEILSLLDLQHHISSIIGGLYSLGGQTDKALIEYRVQFDPVFTAITYQGVPDIRLVVFLGVPVMAMLRLPTRQSQGKANLHQGAIGVGIDIATGRTTTAVSGNTNIDIHPDTGQNISDVYVPHWDRMLEIAAQCNELTGMGYLGADFVLDQDKGPLLLELNARPGLNIQIANRAGLLPRMQQVQAIAPQKLDAAQRVAFAKQHFHD